MLLLKRHVLFFLSVKTAKTNSKDWVAIRKYLFLTVLEPGRSKTKVWGDLVSGEKPLPGCCVHI